ncbi:MAG: universal stress protein [Gemmataceae bacterium]
MSAASDLKADLLCISTHGRTGLAHLLLGSVAKKIIRHAPCPVLTVPPDQRRAGGVSPLMAPPSARPPSGADAPRSP